MSTSEKPLIVVAGATGHQGGSVSHALIKSGNYRVKGIARHLDTDKARELQQLGVELVQCDVRERENLVKCLRGAHGLYAMTDFWKPEVEANHNLETQEGKNLIDAAVSNNVQHIIFSSLDDAERASGGRLDVPHFTNKNKVERYAREQCKNNNISCSFVYCGCYCDNFLKSFQGLVKGDDGIWRLRLPVSPNTRIPLFDPQADLGKIVLKMFEQRDQLNGKVIRAAAEYLTVQEIANILSEVSNKDVRYEQCSYEEYQKIGGDELTQMFRFFEDCGYFLGHDIDDVKRLVPQLTTFRQSLQNCNWRLD